MSLSRLGATEELRALIADGLTLARVATSTRDRYRLISEEGEFDAEPSGGLLYRAESAAELPVAGDWVAARVVGDAEAIVEAVLPRRTLFARRAAGTREDAQPIAANVDVVLIVCGLDGDFNPRRLERYLALAAGSGARPVVVLSKRDLCADLAARIRETEAVTGGVPVVAVDGRSAEGLASLSPFLLPGTTIALVGSSGVGKSTLVNRLAGEERQTTAEVRANDSRGRHTTTRRELIPLPSGAALIDTPGMRELQLWAGADAVDTVFQEIAELAAHCRFRDCTHSGETGCAVAEALATDQLDSSRWESYRKLRAEARRHESMTDRAVALERKRKWKLIHKAQRAYLAKSPKHQ